MAQKNFKNLDNKLNDINVSRFNSAFFLSPIEFVNKEPIKENNFVQNLENQSLKIDDEHDADPISHKKDYQTPRSIDTNLKKCLGQDLLKHLDGSPMRQHKFPPSSNQFGQNKNSFFYKKISGSEENEFSIDLMNDDKKLQKLYKLSNIPGSKGEILKKRFNDDFYIGMPLRTEEAYLIYEKNLCRNFFSLEDYNKYYQINNDLNRLQYLKAEIFEKVLGPKEDYFSFYLPLNKARSFYFNCDYNKIFNSHPENFDNFYMGNDKEKAEDEPINLNNSDEYKNEFLEQNKNFNNFNYTQPSHNESSACKNINNVRKNKNTFTSHLDYDNEDERNIYSSIFSNNRIKKSNSTNYLGEFQHKIPFDPDLFSTDNNNLERIFHSPNFYNFNSSHTKEKNIFEEENLDTNFNYADNNQNNVFSHNKKNSLSNSNLKKLAQSTSSMINQQPHEKFVRLLKIDQENQKMPNTEHLENLKGSDKNRPKKVFEDSTSAYSNMQKNIPSFTPNSEFSREMQANNLINKNKNSFLYPNYSDFSDSINIPSLNTGGNNSNPNLNPYSAKKLSTNKNKNDIIYENQNDYESENYGMSNFEEFENDNNNINNNNNKDLYRDIEGENIVNNFLNDEVTYTPSRRDKNDESFDKRNYETFDCCNIDSFINPRLNNAPKSGYHNCALNNNQNKNEDTILNIGEGNNMNNNNNKSTHLGDNLNERIDNKFAELQNQTRNPFNRNNSYNLGSGLKTETGPSTRKLPLVINDDICFYPKSIRGGVAAGNVNKNNLTETQNENQNNSSNKNESLYNIIDNFKNFTNLSENNLRNANRNINNNDFLNTNNPSFENRNNFFSQSNKGLNNNLMNKIEPHLKKEDNSNQINFNQSQQQKLQSQNNPLESNEDFSSSDNYPSSTTSFSQNMNLNNNLNNQGINNKNVNQGVNVQMGDKQQKQGNQSSQNKTGWVCSQCKNFNYEMRHKCNRCGKPQSRPLDLFTRNPNFQQGENFNPNLNPNENELINQNSLNSMKNQALSFNNMQNNKLVSPQNKFNSMRNLPVQGSEDIIINPQNPNFQRGQKLGFDNKFFNPQFPQSQIYNTQNLNNMQTNENMFNNLSNYYNNNQGNENFNLIKNNFQKISNSHLQNFNTSQNKGEGLIPGFSGSVQPPIEADNQQFNHKNIMSAKEINSVKASNPPVHSTFPYPPHDRSQLRNNIQSFGNYSNNNSLGRDNYGGSKNYLMNLNNLQQNLNQNLSNNLINNNKSNIKSPVNQNLIPNAANSNIANLANVNQDLQGGIIRDNQNLSSNQGQNITNNKIPSTVGNLTNNPLSQLGNNLGQTYQNFDQQQQQFNLQNNLNNFNNLNNLANQVPIANRLGGFANINFASDFKKKYTPLDNLRLQNPSLNLLNSPQMNASLNLNKENLLNAQNISLKSKAIGVNNLFDVNLEENLRNFNMQNAQNPMLNKAASDKKISGFENAFGSVKQLNTPSTNISAVDKSPDNKLNKLNSPNKHSMSGSVNTTMAQSSENMGRLANLNFESMSNSENFSNLSNLNNLANMNLNPNLNPMNNMNLSLQQQNEDNLANQDKQKKKKPFVERVGDWVCIKCKNLNFSFRVVCNRCQLTKAESDKLFEQYMKNLMNYVKINEIIQNQIMNYPHLNTNFINQISNMDINSQQGLSDFLAKNNMSLDANGNLVGSNPNNVAVLPQQPEGFGNNVNYDLNNFSNNFNNLKVENDGSKNDKENAQLQTNSNMDNVILSKDNSDNMNIEDNKNTYSDNTNPIPNVGLIDNFNNNSDNFGGDILNNNKLRNNNNNLSKIESNYPTIDEINSKEVKQENKSQEIPVINNQNLNTNTTKQVSENKDNKNNNNITDLQKNKKDDKQDVPQKNQEEIISDQNTSVNSNTAVNPSSSNNNYQSNQENYNSTYDSNDNYAYNSSSKGSYYNNYYSQNKNYRNDYNSSNRNYRNPNNKNTNTNKNMNYDKRSNQYYKNSGFSSDVHNK